jgi:hypothetical protein
LPPGACWRKEFYGKRNWEEDCSPAPGNLENLILIFETLIACESPHPANLVSFFEIEYGVLPGFAWVVRTSFNNLLLANKPKSLWAE